MQSVFSLAKNRPHITLTKEEAKVPEIKFELYSFKSTIKCRKRREQENWFESKVRF